MKFFSVMDQWDMVEGEPCPYLICCSTFSSITVTCYKPTVNVPCSSHPGPDPSI